MSAPARTSAASPGVLLAFALVAAGCARTTASSAPPDDRFACSHVFLPMRPSLRRDYVVRTRDPSLAPFRYTQSYARDDTGAAGDGGFTETLAFSNGTRRVQRLRCEPGGGWRVLATSVDGASGGFPGGAITARGVTRFPAAVEWRIGTSWTDTGELAGGDLSGLPPAVVAGGGATLSGTVEVTNTIAAIETVDVPAGRFESYRIDATTSQRVVVETGVLGKLPVELVTTTRTWYARGVGLVRQVAEPYGLTTELAAFSGETMRLGACCAYGAQQAPRLAAGEHTGPSAPERSRAGLGVGPRKGHDAVFEAGVWDRPPRERVEEPAAVRTATRNRLLAGPM